MFRTLIVMILIIEASTVFAEEGLKKVNYKNETSDKMEVQPVGKDTPSLTPEQLEKVKKDIEAYKARQAESQKVLDELDKEDQ